MTAMIESITLKDRLTEREAARPGEYGGYIHGLVRLWNEVLEQPLGIVELGTFVGNSGFAWLMALYSSGKGNDGWLCSIDNNQDSARELVNDANRYGWTKHLQCIQDDSIHAGETWQGGSVGMVYIDTAHEYLQTRREIETWLPHIRPGGWLVLDDIVAYPEVLKAFQTCLEVTCKDRFDWFTGYTQPPYTPKSHGLLVAKLR